MKDRIGPRYELSFRQLMAVMALFVLAVVAMPRAVDAAGQLMTIIDRNATTSTQGARVDNDGALHVLPSSRSAVFRQFRGLTAASPSMAVISSPSNLHVATLANNGSANELLSFEVYPKNPSGSCAYIPTSVVTITQVVLPAGETLHLTYPDTHPLRTGSVSSPCTRARLVNPVSGAHVILTLLYHAQ